MDHRKAGVTLVELTIVLVLIGILITIAAPALTGILARARVETVLNQFTADVAYAKMLAIRSGNRAELRFLSAGRCGTPRFGRFTAGGYRITVLGDAPKRVLERDVGDVGRGVCLDSNNDRSIVFNSRGLLVPFENRTVWFRRESRADSLKMSVLGRVRRL